MARYARVEPDTLRTWAVQFGVPGLVLAIGFAMTGYANFWLGVVIMTLAVAALATDFWFKHPEMATAARVTKSSIADVAPAPRDAELSALRAALATVIEVLKECADDLESEVEAHYPRPNPYPMEKRRYDRDMEPVRHARSALAAIDAAGKGEGNG